VKAYTPNDAGNAELFIDRHGDRLRYVHGLEKWLVFTNRWRKDDDGGVHRLAVELSKNLLHEAADIADTAVRDTAVRRALSLGRVKVISDMLNLAKCDARIIIRPSDIDADPWLVGAENGVINLRTGEVKAYNRQTYITKTLGVSYDPAAKCLRWLRFNEEIFEDKAVARYIWKAAGYTLSGMTTEKAFLFLYGKGNNGKTKFTETLFALFGDYAKRAADEILQCSPNGREPEQAKAELASSRISVGKEIAR
jgi:putative DNA primase/helicase